MKNNEIQVIEDAAVFFEALADGHRRSGFPLWRMRENKAREHALALRGLIDDNDLGSKATALPVAYANASGPKSAPRVKELQRKLAADNDELIRLDEEIIQRRKSLTESQDILAALSALEEEL